MALSIILAFTFAKFLRNREGAVFLCHSNRIYERNNKMIYEK